MKRVIKNKAEEVIEELEINDADNGKVYCYSSVDMFGTRLHIYKLQRIYEGKCGFVDMDNSYWSEYRNDDLIDCLKEAIENEEEIYEFEDQEEFIKWAFEELALELDE